MAQTKTPINKVRELAHAKLRQVSRSDLAIKESFLSRDEHYCGIRFRLGLFWAQWFLGQSTIQIYRDEQEIAKLTIEEQPIKRAA